MRKLALIQLLILGYMLVAWIVNIVKLLNCDFEGPVWKEEIIHAIGLIPGVSMITCWF
jgi:hypothetical protein